MSDADTEIRELKLAILEAESRRQRAHALEVKADVDIRVLREKLQCAEMRLAARAERVYDKK